MKEILIDFGLLPIDAVEDYISMNNGVKILIEDRQRYNILKNAGICESKLFLQPCDVEIIKEQCTYQDIRNTILNDSKIYQLYDRTETPFHTTSKKISVIASKVDKATTFLEAHTIEVIIFNTTPHNCNNWIIARCAELLNIRVLYFKSSIIPWRFNFLEGLNIKPKKILISDKVDEDEIKDISSYINSKKGSRLDALPDYERKRLDANNGKFYSLYKDLIRNWKRPDLVINKFLCYNRYKKLSRSTPREQYVLFFLHFQPERTTLPEGYGFTQQILAIKTLRKCLASDVKLLVKEHPSTFTNSCHWKERTRGYYDDILKIGGTELVSIEEDSYTLIDNAQHTATISGTILFESIVRGTPAIAFGLAPLFKSDAFHTFESESELTKFLKSKPINEYDVLGSLEHTINGKDTIYKRFHKGSSLTHQAAASGVKALLLEFNT